jgi:hypothetical protein
VAASIITQQGCRGLRFSFAACGLVAYVSLRRDVEGRCWRPTGSREVAVIDRSFRSDIPSLKGSLLKRCGKVAWSRCFFASF